MIPRGSTPGRYVGMRRGQRQAQVGPAGAGAFPGRRRGPPSSCRFSSGSQGVLGWEAGWGRGEERMRKELGRGRSKCPHGARVTPLRLTVKGDRDQSEAKLLQPGQRDRGPEAPGGRGSSGGGRELQGRTGWG